MVGDFLSNSTIVAAYRERTCASARLAEQAADLFPSGITHDVRHLKPYGIYVERAAGARKWDVDGNEYVDHVGGHGAMILGHGHPKVVEAVRAAMAEGSHFGAGHAREIRWAGLIRELMPSAERVRFTASGTEATLLALRLARAHTGRRKVIRFQTHFHGWHDHFTAGVTTHFDGSAPIGVLDGVVAGIVQLPPWDIGAVAAALESDSDIAAAIVEPTGATFGRVPTTPAYMRELRELTTRHGVVLIYDEVVTGFRVAPGGAQAIHGVRPDLTTLGKIVAGGMPGGAVAGRAEILDGLDFDACARLGREKIPHQGTFNANPVCAAAGIAALEEIGTTGACATANAAGAYIRDRLAGIVAAKGLPWGVYGAYSGFHVFTNPKGRALPSGAFDPFSVGFLELKTNPPDLPAKLRLATLLHGADITGWPGGTVTAAHTEKDLDVTAAAFARAVDDLHREGEI